jgi:hypothetical protein
MYYCIAIHNMSVIEKGIAGHETQENEEEEIPRKIR